MSKRECRELLFRLLPYVNGRKQVTALCVVVLMIGMTRTDFDAPHVHVEPAPVQPTTVVAMAATASMARFDLSAAFVDVPIRPSAMGYGWDTESDRVSI
jgi:hypothetical protein